MSWQNDAAIQVMSILFLEIKFFSETLLRKYIEGIRDPVLTNFLSTISLTHLCVCILKAKYSIA